MEEKGKQKRKNGGKGRPKKRFKSSGTPMWGQRSMDGPGIWITCVRSKEDKTAAELCELFEPLSIQLWPQSEDATSRISGNDSEEDSDDGGEVDIEKQLANEVASMKRPKAERRLVNCQTNTPCVVFLSCKPPVDPVHLVVTHVENVIRTGVTQTRFAQRLTPISASCVANIPEIKSLCSRLLKPIMDENPERGYKYKIELRIRNHNTVTRMPLIEELAKCVPETYQVDLEDPELFILVEIFKSICGISIVKDFYKMQKFNVMEIANAKNVELQFQDGEGRVNEKKDS